MALTPEQDRKQKARRARLAAEKETRERKEAIAEAYEQKFQTILDALSEYLLPGERYKSELLINESLTKIWEALAKNQKILGSNRTFDEWLELRDKGRKDLFWLTKDVFKKDITEKAHRIVCEQFVQKNFDGVYKQGYSLDDVHDAFTNQTRLDNNGIPTREMMLLDQRSGRKSTINGVDCVQWLLNAPDCRIMIICGEFQLSKSFLEEIKAYFYLAEDGELTDFQKIYPEYILRGMDGTSSQPLLCPVRRHWQRGSSVWTNSVTANTSGWHMDVRKTDDAVTNANSKNETARIEIKKDIDGTDDLVDGWGFSDFIGTRYHTMDWYGTRRNPRLVEPDFEGEIAPIKYFCRGGWTVKPEFAHIPLKKLEEHMVDVTFPEKVSFRVLKGKLNRNEMQFRNQQLNDPHTSADDDFIPFNIDQLRAHSYPEESAPKVGDVFVAWDWALTAGKASDYSAGAVGRIYQKKDGDFGLCILDVVWGKYKDTELSFQIISLIKKWSPKTCLIEKSNGSEFLQREIAMQANKYQVDTSCIFWKQPSNEPDAKRNRLKGLGILLDNDSLWFVNRSWMDDGFAQFVRYTGDKKSRGRKDDIPDAISYLQTFIPATEVNEDLEEQKKKQIDAYIASLQYIKIFGGQSDVKPEQVIEMPKTSPMDAIRNKVFGGLADVFRRQR